jgi:bacillithiol system protein YtxJ
LRGGGGPPRDPSGNIALKGGIMQDVTDSQALEQLFGADEAILFKHNTTCPISAMAHEQMTDFEQRHPEAPINIIDIHASRDLSDSIEERTGITHESPQVILLRQGKPVFHESRMEIRADALEQHLGGAANG